MVEFELDPDRPILGTPVLVHGLSGLIDAGGATRLAIEHILETCDHARVATFDVDALYDYRERRPRTIFDSDHYSSIAMPEIAVDAAVDMQGEQFLSPYWNRRDDEYGGDAERRMRLSIEALTAVREEIGPNRALGIRFNCDEMLPGGWDAEEAREILARFVAHVRERRGSRINGDATLFDGRVWTGAAALPLGLALAVEGFAHGYPLAGAGQAAAPAASALVVAASHSACGGLIVARAD